MPRLFRRLLVAASALALGLAGAVVVASPAAAVTFTVNNTADGMSPGTLRWAVDQANTTPGEDVISIDTPLLIFLQAASGGPLVLTEGVTVEATASPVIVQRDAGFNVFEIQPGMSAFQDYEFIGFKIDGLDQADGRGITAASADIDSLALTGMTFANLRTGGSGGAVHVDASAATVGITNSSFTGNGAPAGNGGALNVDAAGSLTITGSTFGTPGDGNTAHASGGAGFVGNTATATLTNVTAVDNESGPDGGGGAFHFENGENVTIDGGLYQENTAPFSNGGAIRVLNFGTLVSVEGGARFLDNHATTDYGGALSIEGGGDPAVQFIEGSSFVGNDAGNVGGAVYVDQIGTFTAQNATFTGNDAQAGGAIYTSATFTTFLAELSTFSENAATEGNGGAINIKGMLTAQQSVTVRSSLFATNSASGSSAYGGAFAVGATDDDTVVSVDSSTFVDNNVTSTDGPEQGASIGTPNSIAGRIDVFNSTFLERMPTDAHAVYVAQLAATGLLTVRNTTLQGREGIWVVDNQGGVQITNSILEAPNGDAVNLGVGNLVDAKYSLFSSAFDAAVIADETSNRFELTDMKLGPLQSNGGPTPTRLPANDSPAVNTGNAAIETDLPATDQRGPGFPRVSGSALDIGAVEVQVPPLPATGSTIPLWIPIVGGVVLLVGIAAIVFAIVSRRRLRAIEAPVTPEL